jgi:predicted CXXCH cytochrome family protein
MRAAHAGGSSINSGEARDFLLGGCSHALECTSCHDPHGEDDRQKLERLGGVEGNELCTHCHSELAPADAQRRHSHHESGGPGSFCLDCHMPKKNMGLQYELTRYHRIGSPTDRERVEGDRPLECALCHTDKSVEQITLTMEKLWNKHYDRDKLRRLYGHDLQQNTILLTLLGGKPHERAVAMAVAARDRVPGTLPLIVDGLENDYPLVRYFARHSLEKRFGEPIPLDMSADGPDLALAAKQWIETHAATAR